MDIFTVSISKIYSVQEFKHCVLVDCDTDCYGKKEHNHVVFHKYQWERIHSHMQYLENEGHDENSLKYFENLTEEEYHKRFERTLSEYTDEELVEEINKSAASLFHYIQFNVQAVVKNG